MFQIGELWLGGCTVRGMKYAIDLLNVILDHSNPHDTIRLPMCDALILAGLNERELGPLSRTIRAIGVVRALEEEGLFSRNVVISYDNEMTVVG
jgi:hypothetical protein